MNVSDWIAVASLFVGSGLAAWAVRKLRHVGQMADDWRGRPERRDPMTGVVIDPGRASLPGRIAALEAQIHPNHGTSLHDQVRQLVEAVRQLQREHALEETRQS